MSEIEKMYENAGIEKITIKGCYEYYAENAGIDIYITNDCKNKDCNICKANKSIQDYPPFTAEKQIKIIEWLGNSKAFFDANETIFSLITNHKDKNGVVKSYEGKGNSVDSCLASLINNLWQDLTTEEKQQVKEILE